MAYCGKCGNELKYGVKFCPKCGNRYNESPSDSTGNPDTEVDVTKFPFKKIGILFLIVTIILVICNCLLFKNNSTKNLPENVAETELPTVDSMEVLAKSIEGCEKLFSFKHGIAAFVKNGKLGIVDKNGHVVAPAIYDLASNFDDDNWHNYAYISEGLIRLFKNNKYGFIDITGKVIIPFEYEDTGNFKEGLVNVKVNNKWGFINKSGKFVIPCEYDYASQFHEGRASVVKNGVFMYIDTSGTVVINLGKGLNHCADFIDGVATVKNSSGLYGLIDKKGNFIVPCKYININHYFYDGLMLVTNQDGDGYINKKGKEVIPCEYGMAFDFHDGIARVFDEYGGHRGYYINVNGEKVLSIDEENSDYYDDFYEGVACVKKDGLYGFIDKAGNVVIDYKYDNVHHFSENYAIIKDKGKYGFINHRGEVVIQCEYDNANDFHDGYAVVEKDGKIGYVDKHGNSTIDIINAELADFTEKKESGGNEIEKVQEEIEQEVNDNSIVQQDYNNKIMSHVSAIQQIMNEINRIHNRCVAVLIQNSNQAIGVNAVADISDLTIEGDRHFRQMISLAREMGKQEDINTFRQEMDDFDYKSNQMKQNILRLNDNMY